MINAVDAEYMSKVMMSSERLKNARYMKREKDSVPVVMAKDQRGLNPRLRTRRVLVQVIFVRFDHMGFSGH